MDASSDYYESDNFKRNNSVLEHEEESPENLKNFDYIRELIKERNQLDSDSHASRLLDQGRRQFSGENCWENSHNFIDFSFLVASFSVFPHIQKFKAPKRAESPSATTDTSMSIAKSKFGSWSNA